MVEKCSCPWCRTQRAARAMLPSEDEWSKMCERRRRVVKACHLTAREVWGVGAFLLACVVERVNRVVTGGGPRQEDGPFPCAEVRE